MNPNKSKLVLILRESNVIMGLKRVHIHKEKQKMKEIKLQVEDYIYEFYKNIGICAGGKSTERVMTDALFRLAGEMSMNAINEKEKQKKRISPVHRSQKYTKNFCKNAEKSA